MGHFEGPMQMRGSRRNASAVFRFPRITAGSSDVCGYIQTQSAHRCAALLVLPLTIATAHSFAIA